MRVSLIKLDLKNAWNYCLLSPAWSKLWLCNQAYLLGKREDARTAQEHFDNLVEAGVLCHPQTL